MELADCATSEALVAAILKQAPDMPIPVPVEEIASQLDITSIRDLETDGFEGGLLAFEDRSSGTILVNARSNRQRRRFTIGHELGHFLNPWHKPHGAEGFRCTARDMRLGRAKVGDRAAQMEVEANRFSAGLLLPLPHFQKDLARLKTIDVGHVLSLATRYDMSKESTARRYVEENDEPSAAVVSQNGKLLRCYRHKSFPFVDVRAGQPLPGGSATARLELGEGTCSGWAEVDGGLWLDTNRGRGSRTVYEQVLAQQQGFRLTLLTVEDTATIANEEEEDEEQTLEAAWTPRFRK
jgi:Zn-dependent peptidase ImmA (M78 family)